MTTRMSFVAVIALAWATAVPAGAAPAAPRTTQGTLFRWSRPNVEIHNPCFSPDGSLVAMVIEQHTVDGAEAEILGEKRMAEDERRIARNPRYADPCVVLLRVGTKETSHIDWGWSPAFSPDGNRVAYTRQEGLLSGQRVLAATLKGNAVAMFDRTTQTTSVLASPEGHAGSLSIPRFSPDGSRILFGLSEPVNGAFEDTVGIAEVTVRDGKFEMLVAPAKRSGFYERIGEFGCAGDSLVATVFRPHKVTRNSMFIPDDYTCDLLKVGPPPVVLHTWMPDKDGRLATGFAEADGTVLFWDNGWHALTTTGTVELSKRPADAPSGTPSPDMKYVALVEGKKETRGRVEVRELATNKLVRGWDAGGNVDVLVWSPDSKRLGVIVTKSADRDPLIFLRDELQVLVP